jgi:glyoxylase-like metal-dependent hydrolase (beta-lactamase superfamily II)
MTCFICVQCGSQFADSAAEPGLCPIGEDDRQYVRWEGQAWTTHDELRRTHRNELRDDTGLLGIGIEPRFAIGQRALLVQSQHGNVLWDCVSLITDEAVAEITKRGGLLAIAISHPHYYSSMVAWSEAFGDAPICLHADDRQWVMRPDRRIELWNGETLDLGASMTLVRCGGHFAGATVLHWPGRGGKGQVLAGDVLQVAADRRYLSFMYSYPNYIPLNAPAVRRIAATLEPFEFEVIRGAWWGANIMSGGKDALVRSVDRYIRAITDA